MTTLVVTEETTYRGGAAFATPSTALAGHPIGEFLDWVARMVAGVGVVLLDGWAAGRLGLPVEALPSGGGGKQHPAAVEARRAGWSVDEVWRWTRFRREGREVHVGLLDLIDDGYCPLIDRATPDTGAFDAWQELAGTPYVGDPGDAVNHLIRQTAKCSMYGKPLVPVWACKEAEATVGQYARTFNRAAFDTSAGQAGRYLVGYDATRAYLAAMQTVMVAPLPLRPTGRLAFDPALAGWWLVDLAPWTLPGMPAPWGHYPDRADLNGMVWLTTPDLALLTQLHADNRYAGFAVVDSHTSRAQRGVLRPAAERLRDMWDAAGGIDDAADGRAVRDAIGAGYKAAHGKWRSQRSDIRRPDWAAALVATARTNLWRRADTATRAGWWPAYIDGIDTVWYATDDPTVHPPGIVTDKYPLNTGRATDKLGTFRAKYLTDRQEETQ
jgi:hypothetical protein